MLGGFPPERKDPNMKTITKTIMYLQMTALCLTAALAGPAAAEKEVPFRGSVQAVEIPVGGQFPRAILLDGSGSGNATHLGRFTVTYELEIDLPNLFGIGPAHFITANGDSISTEIISLGYETEDPDVLCIVDTHTITGGTGRFAGATGSFTVERFISSVTGVTSGSFDGTISY
jgi:hypothetical protein